MAAGGIVIDIRPAAQRQEEGSLPGAIVVERNVLEWRLDVTGTHRLAEVQNLDQPVVIVCSEGYASSLAAAALADLGFKHPADLVGGYRAWRSWFEHRPIAAFAISTVREMEFLPGGVRRPSAVAGGMSAEEGPGGAPPVPTARLRHFSET